jgi:hypothetical protein
MNRSVPALALSLLATGCIFGGPPKPTLEMQSPPAGGPVDVQIVDSSVEPGEVYLKLVVHNAGSRLLHVDRRAFVLSDGRAEWRPAPTSKPFVTVKPSASSSKLKLTYEGVPAGLPAYDLLYKRGAFKWDGEGGQEVTLPAARLLLKKVEVATPQPAAASGPQPR